MDSSLTLNAAFAVGFALLGPLVVNLVSAEAVIAVVAVLYLVAFFFCLALPAAPPPSGAGMTLATAFATAGTAIEGTASELREGLVYIRDHPSIRWSLIYLAITASLIGILGVLGPGFATEVLGLRTQDFVVVVLPLGVGVVVGVLVLNAYGALFSRAAGSSRSAWSPSASCSPSWRWPGRWPASCRSRQGPGVGGNRGQGPDADDRHVTTRSNQSGTHTNSGWPASAAGNWLKTGIKSLDARTLGLRGLGALGAGAGADPCAPRSRNTLPDELEVIAWGDPDPLSPKSHEISTVVTGVPTLVQRGTEALLDLMAGGAPTQLTTPVHFLQGTTSRRPEQVDDVS